MSYFYASRNVAPCPPSFPLPTVLHPHLSPCMGETEPESQRLGVLSCEAASREGRRSQEPWEAQRAPRASVVCLSLPGPLAAVSGLRLHGMNGGNNPTPAPPCSALSGSRGFLVLQLTCPWPHLYNFPRVTLHRLTGPQLGTLETRATTDTA